MPNQSSTFPHKNQASFVEGVHHECLCLRDVFPSRLPATGWRVAVSGQHGEGRATPSGWMLSMLCLLKDVQLYSFVKLRQNVSRIIQDDCNCILRSCHILYFSIVCIFWYCALLQGKIKWNTCTWYKNYVQMFITSKDYEFQYLYTHQQSAFQLFTHRKHFTVNVHVPWLVNSWH